VKADLTLHLGDCIEGMRSLADDSVDVTITDPPYEAEAHTKQRRQKGVHRVVGREEYRAVNEAPLDFIPITPKLRRDVGAEIARVTRHCAVVFCQVEAVVEWEKALTVNGMKYRRCVPWNKPDAMPSLHGRWPGQSFEAIVIATKTSARPCPIGGKAISYTCVRDKFGHGGVDKCPHPTTKPLALMRGLVVDFSVEGDLVLDPFAGSGTTGVACRQLGRRFVGWELNAEYHAIATRRLNGDEAKPRPEQPSLFKAGA
jgi:site-specific DNA-methyltransferase (adenine-specific)